uniref:Conotoxin Gla(3)-TxVI n=1 Tax=Conus textile TaxID=6494 RepID=O236E_CONTE|nr:RecName: Full=Conotoxin Gla(3)-TxVI; AltName: Full=Conotoxin Glu7/Gla(3)-TxVI; AltName: Full=Conotoxin TxMEKL-04111; Flags: Precursor [Conus textile]AAG60449.1 conotoxin scaffold VI/VII precursor [Conus textile]
MQKLIILLLVAAVLMSAQAVLQEKRPKEKIKFLSKRKTDAEKQQKRLCPDYTEPCSHAHECCSWNCYNGHCTG